MELIFDKTPKGGHTVTLMLNNKPAKGFISNCPIKCINMGQKWLKRAKINQNLHFN